ncbi:MAG: TPM domain-containing protein [Myxococcota bacterium]|nr:TPM domain-containing protein [Myxococcota bacterium]
MLRLLLIPVVLAISVQEVPNPRSSHGGWVTDQAEQIAPETEAAMEARLDLLHQETGVEVAVVTVDTIPTDPKSFATELFNTWKIGSAERNDGLLVLLVMSQRRLEMETGYGLEDRLPDAWLGRMQRKRMVPHFKEGAFGDGLLAGLEVIDDRLRSRETEQIAPAGRRVPVGPGVGVEVSDDRSSGGGGGLIRWGLLGVLGILFLFFSNWFLSRRYLRCKPCKARRALLDEHEDDEHLEKGEIREEELKSVNYDVYVCPRCSSVAIDRKARFWSGYTTCEKCSCKTLETTKTVTSAATRSSSGTARISEKCMHCKHKQTYTKTIPRLPDPSTSSSSTSGWSSSSSSFSSGSSFGGGSSGGGGAGSSW